MFQASFEPNANFYTAIGQELAQADSLPDTSTRFFFPVQKNCQFVFFLICLTDFIIMFDDLKYDPRLE